MKCLPVERAALPTDGNLAFGARRTRADGSPHIHRGVDLPRPQGTPIYSVADGRVEWALARWEQGFSGYGGHVVIAHADGTRALYAHVDTVQAVKGRSVFAGEQIATVGNTVGTQGDPTKRSGGAHLHFEISPRPYPQASEAPRLDPRSWLGAAIEPRIARAIAIAAQATGVELPLLRALAWVQSHWNPAHKSSTRAGLFGFTHAQSDVLGIDPTKPEQASSAAAHLIARGLREFGSVASAIASFVWGVDEVRAHPLTSQWPAAVEMNVAAVLGRWNDERGSGTRAAIPLGQPGTDDGSRS